jgi:hypothetical protein
MTWNKAANRVSANYGGYSSTGDVYRVTPYGCDESTACATRFPVRASRITFDWQSSLSPSAIIHETAHLLQFQRWSVWGEYSDRYVEFKEGLAQLASCGWGGIGGFWCTAFDGAEFRYDTDEHWRAAGIEGAIGRSVALAAYLDSSAPNPYLLRGGRWGSFAYWNAVSLIKEVEPSADHNSLWAAFGWARSRWMSATWLDSRLRTSALMGLSYEFQERGVPTAARMDVPYPLANAPYVAITPGDHVRSARMRLGERVLAFSDVANAGITVSTAAFQVLNQSAREDAVEVHAYYRDPATGTWRACGTTRDGDVGYGEASSVRVLADVPIMRRSFELSSDSRHLVDLCLIASRGRERVDVDLVAVLVSPAGQVRNTSHSSAGVATGMGFPFQIANDMSDWIDKTVAAAAFGLVDDVVLGALSWVEFTLRWSLAGSFLDNFLLIWFAFAGPLFGCGSGSAGAVAPMVVGLSIWMFARRRKAGE